MLQLLFKLTNLRLVIVFVKSMLWVIHALRLVLNTVTSVSRLIVEKNVDVNDTTCTEGNMQCYVQCSDLLPLVHLVAMELGYGLLPFFFFLLEVL